MGECYDEEPRVLDRIPRCHWGASEALPFTLSSPIILELRKTSLREGSSQLGLRSPAGSPPARSSQTSAATLSCHSCCLWPYHASPSSVGEAGSDKPHSGEPDIGAMSGVGWLFCKQPCYYLSEKVTPSLTDGGWG